MPKDPQYTPAPFVYRSKGETARPAQDEAPEYTYLLLMNTLERQEGAMSSRYGTQIINRDPAGGSGTNNYYFGNPVISLARMTYLGQSYRYAETSDGSLFRRQGDTQGPYTGIASGLSGFPFGWVISNCFETSQPFLFIYDRVKSIKDSGTGVPELTGIDPSSYTANILPHIRPC